MLFDTRLKRFVMLSLFAAFVAVGCDSMDSTAPEPAAAAAEYVVNGVTYTPVAASVPGGYRLAEAWIGSEGGALEVGGHRIVVPAGAVTQDALFAVDIVRDGTIHVELTATARGGADIGGAGFVVPVTLELSYAALQKLPAGASIVRLPEGGNAAEVMPTANDSGKKVLRTELEHFSGYIVAM